MSQRIAAQPSRPTGALARSSQQTQPRTAIAAFAIAVSLVALGCHREQPVARVAAESARIQFPHGRHTEITLHWEPLVALPGGVAPVAFLHLLDAQHNIVRTFD